MIYFVLFERKFTAKRLWVGGSKRSRASITFTPDLHGLGTTGAPEGSSRGVRRIHIVDGLAKEAVLLSLLRQTYMVWARREPRRARVAECAASISWMG